MKDRFLRGHPGSGEGYYLAARVAYARKKPEEVLAMLSKARERGYPEAPLERLLGLVYAGSGRVQEAEPLLRAAWDRAERADADVGEALCRLYYRSFHFEQALRVANAWIKRDPRDIRALLWRARFTPGTTPAPRPRSATSTPSSPSTLTSTRRDSACSRPCRRLGRLEDAKRDYDLYLKARPDDPLGLEGAAKTAEGLDEGRRPRLLRSHPGGRPEERRRPDRAGLHAIRRKDYADAIRLLDAAIAREPNDPEPHYRKGQALDRLGRHDEAQVEFAAKVRLQKEQEKQEKIRKGLVRNPDDVSLMASAAEWLLGHGYDAEGHGVGREGPRPRTRQGQPDPIPRRLLREEGKPRPRQLTIG